MVLGSWYFGFRAQRGDRELPVYVRGGERMAAGEEIYRRGLEGKPFTYPPFAAVPFVPFAWLPDTWQAPAWFVVSFLILLAIIAGLHRFGTRPTSGTSPPKAWRFWLLTALFGSHHVFSVLSNQSHDLFLAGTVTLTALAWGRGTGVGALLAGFWSGVGGAIKATPLLFLGLFGLRLRFGAVLTLLGAFAFCSLLPDWIFPRQDGASWLVTWFDVNLRGLEVGGTASAAGAWNAHSNLNQSLSGLLTRLFTDPVVTDEGHFVIENVALTQLGPTALRAVTITCQLLVLALLALAARLGARAIARGGDAVAMARTVSFGEVGAFACGMVLLSPQSSKAHFCIWLVPAAFLADRLLRGPRDRWLGLLLVGAVVLGPLASKGIVGSHNGRVLLAYGNVTWCTLLLLLATLRGLWTAARRE